MSAALQQHLVHVTTSPSLSALRQAALISLSQDKVIKLDYYADSLKKSCKLVKTQDSDTILFKSNDEYTSPITKVFQVDSDGTNGNQPADIICVSENSIYIVSSAMLAK
jgi:hypothetical protein